MMKPKPVSVNHVVVDVSLIILHTLYLRWGLPTALLKGLLK